MRNVRMLTLTALLVVVLGLSACTVTLPAASAGLSTLNQQLGNLLPRASAPAQAAAQTSAANVPQLVPPATDISDLQMALEQLYTAVNPTVVNIQVTMAGGRGPDGTDPWAARHANCPICRSSLTRIRLTARTRLSRDAAAARRWAPVSSGTSRATSSPTTTWSMALRKSPSLSPTV